MPSTQKPDYTPLLVRAYSAAAIENARELLVEATLLVSSDHFARAYFLASACIEECGKALLLFDSEKRNFADPAVCSKLKASIEDHKHKTTYALASWALHGSTPRDSIEVAIALAIDVSHGREPSMYSDMRFDLGRPQRPKEVVKPEVARDCVRLASDCLANTEHRLSTGTPPDVTRDQDRFFVMKKSLTMDLMKTRDLWEFYVTRAEAGDRDFARAIVEYEREYLRAGKLFKPEI